MIVAINCYSDLRAIDRALRSVGHTFPIDEGALVLLDTQLPLHDVRQALANDGDHRFMAFEVRQDGFTGFGSAKIARWLQQPTRRWGASAQEADIV